MEVEHYAQQLHAQIQQKVEQNPTYRKAQGVLQSLMHAAKTIPNFNNNIASNRNATALYITAGTFKLLKKVLEGDQHHLHQLDSYLLLLSMTLPQSSPTALMQARLLDELKKFMQIILSRKDNTPLMTRLTVSILSHTYAPQMTSINFQAGADKQLLLDLFQRSVASPRSNALSRQCSRLLTHLLKNNPTVSTVIAEYAKANLLSSLQQRKELYLSNVKQVMIQLPVRLLNDICHRVAANLEEVDCSDENQEQYLSQTYFFLEKMITKLLGSTLEDMILVLINNVPAGSMSEKVQLSYLQLLYESVIALVHINQSACNRILSPVISVLMELLLISPKIAKFASNQLTFILNNCIRPSLWRKKQDELSLDVMQLEENGKQFTKIICLFEGLLSTRFSNSKLSALLISIFFNHLEQDAFDECLTLIHKVIEYRADLHQKGFRKVMESIILAFGIQSIIDLYPLNIQGDIAQESFEDQNNLWLLNVIQKTERAENMSIYNNLFLPLLQKARFYKENVNLSKGKRQAYGLVEQLVWRCVKPFTRIIDTEVDYQKVLFLIEKQLATVSENTLQQLCMAIQQLSLSIDQFAKNKNSNYKSKASEQLIKTLAGLLNINNPSSKSILQAIKGLAKIAPVEYVNRVFDKNIEKIISLAEEEGLNKQQQKNLKNLEILMAVNGSINLCDPSVTTKYRISREELLLRLVSSLIKSTGSYQKKGYKYINQTLPAAPRSLYLEILQLMETAHKIQVGAKHHRLGVIIRLWNWLKSGGIQQNLQQLITFIKNHLPEILLTLREQNKGARQIAVQLVGNFADTMQEMGLLQNFVETVCAGLISERSQMKLSTLNGLSIIIGKGYTTQETFKEMLEIVLLLLQQKKQQLYKGVVEFSKKGILSLPIENQKTYLPNIIQLLFEEDEEGKMQHRSILRHFLIKLTKKHGKDALEAMIPQQHRKMLSHALKMENREKRKKKQQNLARMQQRRLQKQNQEDQESSDEEGEAEAPQMNERMDIEQPLDQLDNANNLLLKYDLDKEQFHFQREHRGAAPLTKKNEKQIDQITFDDKGIMIIEERKRPRNEAEQPEQATQAQAQQPLNFKKKSKVQIHQVKESGDTFKTNRAGGDLRLKDKPQPYAFIQFSSKALNKRFKKRAEQVFDALFEKKEGGLRGLKSRIAGAR